MLKKAIQDYVLHDARIKLAKIKKAKDSEARFNKYKKMLEELGFEYNDIGGAPDHLSMFKEEGSARPYGASKSIQIDIDFDDNEMRLFDYDMDTPEEQRRHFDITDDNIPMEVLKEFSERVTVRSPEDLDAERSKMYQKLIEEGKCTTCLGTGYTGPYGDTCSRCDGSGYLID